MKLRVKNINCKKFILQKRNVYLIILNNNKSSN